MGPAKDEAEKEEPAKDEAEKEEPAKDEAEKEESSGGSSSTECKSISNGEKTYFGTVSDGFTASEVHQGADKLVSLLGMASNFAGPDIGKLVQECKADYTADLVEQLLPRCDDKCQPMKQCKSSCERVRSKCVPESLRGYFPMVKKGGSLRSMIGMVGLTEGSSDLNVIDAWINKLEKCESEDVTSSDHCLSAEYKGADCDPTAGGSSGEAEKEEPAKDEAEKEEPAKEEAEKEAEKEEPAKDEAEKKEPAKDEEKSETKDAPAKDIEKNDKPASRTPKLRGGKAKADQDKGAPERLPRQEAAPATKKKSDKCVRIDG